MNDRDWRILACSSRTGADHLRRGVPGQDSVAQWEGSSRDGEPVWVLALADGHGHRRHWLSGVGSALACRVAVHTLRRWLAQQELRGSGPPDLGCWQHQLAADLSRRIHDRWLEAVRRHGSQIGLAQEADSEPYGCTLAALLLTPRWWAVCGLGDWDLVGVNGQGQALLLSEERPLEPGLETTSSLSQVDAADAMAARTQLGFLVSGEPMALLLSSDGVRKSCGATVDYLAWAAALLPRLPDNTLDLQLDQLSSRGTGDDVSVLAVRHGPLAGPKEPAPAARPRQRLPRGRQPARRVRQPLSLRRIVRVSVLPLIALFLALLGLLFALGR